jgi:hypothetical protein
MATKDLSWLSRSELLIGPQGIQALQAAHVLIVGLGGVGSFAAEFIARAGVGTMTIVDGDVVDPSNRNRQLPALATNHGVAKVKIMAERLLAINPELILHTHESFLSPEAAKAILEENKRRGPDQKPLYLMYDQIYWMLTYGNTLHYNPVSLRPEMKDYTIFIDGLSKAFAATGLRVGWTFGPKRVIDKMKSVLGHIGAWAPKAEQVAVANYLKNNDDIEIDVKRRSSIIKKPLE